MKKKTKFSTKQSQIRIFVKKTLYVITFPIRLLCYILIYLYKILIDPLLPKSCRYLPSCSTYALEAIKKYGIVKGVLLAAKRIERCTPKNKSGYDPVPASIEGEMKWLI